MGMTPLEPTPTGMWSNIAWASCSFTGCTSLSSKFVRSKRTPQLMSKPTPPARGEKAMSGSTFWRLQSHSFSCDTILGEKKQNCTNFHFNRFTWSLRLQDIAVWLPTELSIYKVTPASWQREVDTIIKHTAHREKNVPVPLPKVRRKVTDLRMVPWCKMFLKAIPKSSFLNLHWNKY